MHDLRRLLVTTLHVTNSTVKKGGAEWMNLETDSWYQKWRSLLEVESRTGDDESDIVVMISWKTGTLVWNQIITDKISLLFWFYFASTTQ